MAGLQRFRSKPWMFQVTIIMTLRAWSLLDPSK
ncbi:hypothetical protein Golob_020607, partial [Gossypium lobatum]|nr:hypothetical protein [Gossypium lobatum]